MSDNENNDNGGDEMVTKPFKFVTGKLFPRLCYPPRLRANTPSHSWYATPRAPSAARISSERRLVRLRYATWYTDELRRSLGFDARFPNQNQTKHCWQNYVDYHKCIIAKGEEFAPCRQVR
jgi:hypothetical protein